MSRPPAPVVPAPVRGRDEPEGLRTLRVLPDVPPPPVSAGEDRAAIRDAARRRRRAEAGERRRPSRRARRAVPAAVAGVLVLLVGLPLVLAFGPAFPVRTIAVSGVSGGVADQVRQALQAELGRPIALVGDEEVAAALAAVPAVERFALVRRPPNAIEVVVVPRTAVAQERGGDGWAQVDAAHVVLATSGERSDLPVVSIPAGADRAARSYAAAVAAISALAASAPAVAAVRATSPDDVVLTLSSGLLVRWGGADDGAAKAEALHAALRRAAKGATEVDVSSPGVVLTR